MPAARGHSLICGISVHRRRCGHCDCDGALRTRVRDIGIAHWTRGQHAIWHELRHVEAVGNARAVSPRCHRLSDAALSFGHASHFPARIIKTLTLPA
eukprot:2927580-Pyramimonas_sp.AAC.1